VYYVQTMQVLLRDTKQGKIRKTAAREARNWGFTALVKVQVEIFIKLVLFSKYRNFKQLFNEVAAKLKKKM